MGSSCLELNIIFKSDVLHLWIITKHPISYCSFMGDDQTPEEMGHLWVGQPSNTGPIHQASSWKDISYRVLSHPHNICCDHMMEHVYKFLFSDQSTCLSRHKVCWYTSQYLGPSTQIYCNHLDLRVNNAGTKNSIHRIPDSRVFWINQTVHLYIQWMQSLLTVLVRSSW